MSNEPHSPPSDTVFKQLKVSARVQDYPEIFHATRGSCIPILKLPALQNDLFFDVRSSCFDYSEIFGTCYTGSEFAVCYDELFKQSVARVDVDSSNVAWTTGQSEPLSDESDPSGCSEKNQSLSSGQIHHSYDDRKQFNILYHKANPKVKEDILNGVTHVTQFDAIPGYSFTIKETSPSPYVEDESSYLQIERNADFNRATTETKRLRKSLSQPPINDYRLQDYETEPNPLADNENSNSPGKAFVCVSDVSLRTRPLHLPPPSRQSSFFSDRAKNSSRLNSKLKASKSYAFEGMEANYSSLNFDMEVDASSSAAVSAAAMKDAVEKAQVQLSNAKELMERKEGLQKRRKSHMEKDIGHKGEKVIEFDRFNSSGGEKVPHQYEREGSGMKAYAAGSGKNVRNTIRVASSAEDGKDDILSEEPKDNTQSHVPHKTKDGKDDILSEEQKDNTQSQVPLKTKETVARTEATESFEVVIEKKIVETIFLSNQSKSCDSGATEIGIGAVVEQEEYHIQTIVATVDHECQENGKKLEMLKDDCEQVEIKVIQTAARASVGQKEHQEQVKSTQEAGEWNEKDMKIRVVSQHGKIDYKPNEVDKFENDNILTEDQTKQNEVAFKQKLKGVNRRVEGLIKIKEAIGRKGSAMKTKALLDIKEYDIESKADVKQVKDGGKVKETFGQSATEKLENEACERQVNDSKHVKTSEMGQHKESQNEATTCEGKTTRSEGSNNKLKVDLKQQENNKEQICACKAEKKENGLKITIKQKQNTETQKRVPKKEASENTPEDDIELDENENILKEAWEKKEFWKKLRKAEESNESKKRAEMLFKEDNIGNRLSGPNVWTDCKSNIEEERNGEGFVGQNSVHKQLEIEVSDIQLNLNQGICTIREDPKTSNGVNLSGEVNTGMIAGEIHENWETHEPSVCEENESLILRQKTNERVFKSKHEPVEERRNSSDMDPNSLHYEGINDENKDESLCQNGTGDESTEDGIDLIGLQISKIKRTSAIASINENVHILTQSQRERRKNSRGNHCNQEDNKEIFASSQVVQESLENERILKDILPAQKFTNQNPEVDETIICKKIILEEREKDERLKRETDLENDLLKKIEEEKERRREREKDRMAVDTATRKACERSLAEARERTERAAVERATAEVRQRALAEARERLEKASAEARERLFANKASEARLKAERAAVERATAEARDRAFEKAKAEKASYDARDRVERTMTDKFSAYSGNGGFRQSSSSNDLQNLQNQSVGPPRDLKHSQSSVSDGLEGESAQRCKARLQRYQRTAERTAKALAEKNIRDLLAHKEQTERNRLAESLDADVKRWSSGKHGNLRALLSTLQYILGPDSGWQPIPLTDVITAAAVKKAYRKATLCVHPDKLQQRGASIQQKYICEKVFDLLKEAWNKFNSEER